MKKVLLAVAIAVFATAVYAGGTDADKAEKNCVKEKMNNRSTFEKVVERNWPTLERVVEGGFKNDCKMERVEHAEKNTEHIFIEKYNDKADSK